MRHSLYWQSFWYYNKASRSFGRDAFFRAPRHVRFQHIPNSRRNPNNRLVFSGEYGKINLSIYGKARRIQAAAYLLKG